MPRCHCQTTCRGKNVNSSDREDCEVRVVQRLYNKLLRDINVDRFTDKTGAIAAVFIRQGNDFVRLSTTTVDPNGNRAVGSVLDRNSDSYKQLIRGREFVGPVTIFGQEYYSKYAPLITEDDHRVVVALGIAVLRSSICN